MSLSDAKVHHLECFIGNYYTVRPFVLSSDYDNLMDDRNQQYDMKVKSREQRDKVTTENKRLREALSKIASIEDEQDGGDWDEIEEARTVASEALAQQGKVVGDE